MIYHKNKQEIDKYLSEIVGLQVTRTTRAADMEALRFGTLIEKNNLDEEVNIGIFRLHAQHPWRITNQTKVLIGSNDLFFPGDQNTKSGKDFEWYKPGNLRDITLRPLIANNELIISQIILDNFGGLTIDFKNEMKLEIFSAGSNRNEKDEFWRILDNREASKKHIVSTSLGIYIAD